MKIVYDREADALAIDLAPGARSARMVRLAPGVAADFDSKGRLVCVEVLAASSRYPRKVLESLDVSDDWLTLAEAARVSGLQAGTLRQLVHAEKFPRARKRGRDWEITAAELADYLAHRAPAGRPAKRPKARRARRARTG